MARKGKRGILGRVLDSAQGAAMGYHLRRGEAARRKGNYPAQQKHVRKHTALSKRLYKRHGGVF